MEIKVKVTLNTKQVFNFMLNHLYFSFMGYCGMLISVCALAAAIYMWGKMPAVNVAILILAAAMFTVIEPLILYSKSKKQVKEDASDTNPINYVFDDRGIHLSQDDKSVSYGWHEVSKITSTSLSVIIYVGKVRALIITKEALGDKIEDLKGMAGKNTTLNYMKIK